MYLLVFDLLLLYYTFGIYIWTFLLSFFWDISSASFRVKLVSEPCASYVRNGGGPYSRPYGHLQHPHHRGVARHVWLSSQAVIEELCAQLSLQHAAERSASAQVGTFAPIHAPVVRSLVVDAPTRTRPTPPDMFTPGRDQQPVRRWLFQMEELFALSVLAQAAWPRYAGTLLRGSTVSWWQASHTAIGSWQEFKDMFSATYRTGELCPCERGTSWQRCNSEGP